MFLSLTKKSPFYQLTYEVNGKRTTVSTKTKDPEEAKNFMQNFQIKSNSIKQIKEEPPKDLFTLSKFKGEYLDYIKPTHSINYINHSIIPAFKIFIDIIRDVPLKDISSRQVDKFITSHFSKSKYATALYFRTLKGAFSKAVVWNYIDLNPFKKVKLPKIPKAFPTFITPPEFQLIVNNTKKEVLIDLFTFAFYTGMRLSEITNLKWAAVDLQNKMITVQNTDTFTTKSKKERMIPINEKLFNVLVKHLPKVLNMKKDDLVFTLGSSKLNEDFVSKQFKKAVRKSKLNDKIHFHSLRHSFASNLVQKDVSLYIVKELLGHEDLKTTQIYSHLKSENLHNAVNLL